MVSSNGSKGYSCETLHTLTKPSSTIPKGPSPNPRLGCGHSPGPPSCVSSCPGPSSIYLPTNLASSVLSCLEDGYEQPMRSLIHSSSSWSAHRKRRLDTSSFFCFHMLRAFVWNANNRLFEGQRFIKYIRKGAKASFRSEGRRTDSNKSHCADTRPSQTSYRYVPNNHILTQNLH